MMSPQSSLQAALKVVVALLCMSEVVVADYLAINCGGLTYPDGSIPQYYDGVTYGPGPDYKPAGDHTDSSGIHWRSDSFYSGTSTHVTDYRSVNYANTDDQLTYQTERYGMDFYYDFNLPNGAYTVEMRFAETRFNSAGSRTFTIALNGQQVESSLDIFARAGGQNTAYTAQYQVTVTNGLLDIFFNSIVFEAKVNAIRVFSNGGGNSLPDPPSLISIAAGGSNDQYYKGGSTGATQSASYPNYRSGALFEYLLNLQNGDYVVHFAFVEPQFTTPGSRSFDVYIQNFKRISGYDIVAQGGSGSNAVTLQRSVHVSNGLLRIKFQGAGSDAIVSGITVSPLSSSRGFQAAINCGAPLDVLSGLGIIFQKDAYNSGGNALITKPYGIFLPFGGFWDDFLYTSARTGDFSYSVPVPNGAYQVEMHFTETEGKQAGQRVFSVKVQGQSAIQNLDIVAVTGGQLRPIILTADATVSDGTLKIDFTNNAIVMAIYIYPGLAGSSQSMASGPTPSNATTSASSAVPKSAPSTGSGTCPANRGGSGIDCAGGCPGYSAPGSIAVNCGGDDYVSTCGVHFLADNTACNPGDTIPDGQPYCRTNIKGPAGGYSYPKPSTDPPITGTADPHIFESERIGFNTYFFRLDNGVYTVDTYFAEISGSDPSIDVNAEGLRRFTLIFNDNPNSPNQNIDPFALAGDQKFKADPVQTAQITVTNGILKMQLFPTGIRDAPAIKGIWIRKTA